jgi:cobyrinic acid a,c-diamide synthase
MAGLIIAAPRSGSGKTVVTLGLLRYLRGRGYRVAAAKTGPDYIDSSFLAAACGAPCRNLDSWAMRRESLAAEIQNLETCSEIVLCEGVMGLFDGAGSCSAGSTADLAAISGWPVILVVSLEGQAASAAALIEGFAHHRADVTIAGVIFNRVAGERHAAIAAASMRKSLPSLPLLGAVPRETELGLPSRHLGLIPAAEHVALDAFLDRAAAIVGNAVNVDALLGLARPSVLSASGRHSLLPVLGARIAVARDHAFAFAYEAVLQDWRAKGATVSFFSPLENVPPPRDADAIYLPGGYPELYASRIAGNRDFLDGLRHAARHGTAIYGECGGYMVLGESLTDADGTTQKMAGLLPLRTSFAARKLHLGYRAATLASEGPLGSVGQSFRGHEFHYATIIEEGDGTPLFRLDDADGAALGLAGRVAGNVAGSFIHLIDRT